jgi:hypothetical protein
MTDAANAKSSAFPGNGTMLWGSLRRYHATDHDADDPGSIVV